MAWSTTEREGQKKVSATEPRRRQGHSSGLTGILVRKRRHFSRESSDGIFDSGRTVFEYSVVKLVSLICMSGERGHQDGKEGHSSRSENRMRRESLLTKERRPTTRNHMSELWIVCTRAVSVYFYLQPMAT